MSLGPYVAFCWAAGTGATSRSSQAIFCIPGSDPAATVAALHPLYPAVKFQQFSSDFYGAGTVGGELGFQTSALTSDGSGTFGPWFDGTPLQANVLAFCQSLVAHGLSSSVPLLVWLDWESQKWWASNTTAQLTSIGNDARGAAIKSYVGNNDLTALTFAQSQLYNDYLNTNANAALTSGIANVIKSVFPNAVVVNFDSVQISQALTQTDGGGTPYYFTGAPVGGVSSPQEYDQIGFNTFPFGPNDYPINGVHVHWSDPFFNAYWLRQKTLACIETNPTQPVLPEIANYYDSNLGTGNPVPLALTQYWGEHGRHAALLAYRGCVLVFDHLNTDPQTAADAIAVEINALAGGSPPAQVLAAVVGAYPPPTDGYYSYIRLANGNTLGRYTFAGTTQQVTITTPDNKVYTLNRPFGAVGMWFGTQTNPVTGTPPPSGFLILDLSLPGKPGQVALAF